MFTDQSPICPNIVLLQRCDEGHCEDDYRVAERCRQRSYDGEHRDLEDQGKALRPLQPPTHWWIPGLLGNADADEESQNRKHVPYRAEPVTAGREDAEQHDVARLRVSEHAAVGDVRESIEKAAGDGQERREAERAARGT